MSLRSFLKIKVCIRVKGRNVLATSLFLFETVITTYFLWEPIGLITEGRLSVLDNCIMNTVPVIATPSMDKSSRLIPADYVQPLFVLIHVELSLGPGNLR